MKRIFPQQAHETPERRSLRPAMILYALLAISIISLTACDSDPVLPPSAHGDTTSHAFQARTYVIGEPGSILYDVAVINDSLAYAVGQIFGLDSAGKHDFSSYGIAIWNGRDWRPKRLQAVYRQGDGSSLIRATGIYAFSASDVWLAWGDVYQWNGASDTLKIHGIGENGGINRNPIFVTGEAVDKIWGSSGSDLYAVGRLGAAAHFNGTLWHRLQTGTTAPIYDVWGGRDPRTGVQTVLCTATNPVWRSDRRIIRLHPGGSSDTLVRNIHRGVVSVWFRSPERIFTAGEGIFTREPNGSWNEHLPDSLYYTFRVRGNADNDVFVVGAYGFTAHYNGNTWRSWMLPEFRNLTSCDYKGRTCIAVGFTPETRAAAVVFQR